MKSKVYRRAARHAAAWWRRRSGADVTNHLAFIRCNVYSRACCCYKSIRRHHQYRHRTYNDVHLFAWLDHYVCRVSDFLRVAATIYGIYTRRAHAMRTPRSSVRAWTCPWACPWACLLPTCPIDGLESAWVTPRGLARVVMIGGCRFYQSRPIA